MWCHRGGKPEEIFYRKLQARQDYVNEQKARESARTSPDRPLEELNLSKRAVDALNKAGIKNAGDVLKRLELGEQALLSVEGFGRKSLIDMKKQLRQLGYQLPAAAEEVAI